MLSRRILLLAPAVALCQDAQKRVGWRKATEAEIAASSTAPPVDGVLFRTEVAQVRVDAEVFGPAGIVNGLQREDFRIFDNGEAKDIAAFSQDELPLDILLLFDVSGSMRPAIQRVADSASEAFAQLRPGDRVAVMSFNSSARLLLAFSADHDRVGDTIDNKVLGGRFGGGTLIQEAVDEAAGVFLAEPQRNRRRALIVVTDNEGQRTRREEGLLKKLWEADAALCGLITPGMGRTMRVARGVLSPTSIPIDLALRAGVNGLAEKTGGEAVDAANAHALRDLVTRLRRRYSLYYAMPNGKPGDRRDVRVELATPARVRLPGAKVRSRKGYLLPAA